MKLNKIFSILLVSAICLSVILSSVPTFYAEANSNEQLALGGVLDDMEALYDANDPEFPCDTSGFLPSSVDLSTSSSFPQIRSQGGVKSCAAWATTYYQFGYQVAAMNNWNAKNDPTKQFSPKWTYTLNTNGNHTGISLPSVYDVLAQQGAVKYSEFTPSTTATTSEYRQWYKNTTNMQNALKYRISDYKKYRFAEPTVATPIDSYDSVELVTMKSLINSGYVLTFISDFYTWDYQQLVSEDETSHVGEKVCIKYYNGNNSGDYHALAIVGYDDSIQYDLNNDGFIQDYEKGAFKIANSHGTNYGNQGFMWIMYDAFNRVSNTSTQNRTDRHSIVYNYEYYCISVREYPVDLVSKITVETTRRNQIDVDLGLSSIDSNVLQHPCETFLSNRGGSYNFSGLGTTVESATFVFDFGNLVQHPTMWKNYYIEVSDATGTGTVVVSNIELLDSSGKSVVNDTTETSLNSDMKCFRYKLGMVGDVDNNGRVNALDATAIQMHLSQNKLLSDEALALADVDASGNVTITDAVYIQRVLASLDDGFINGVYAQID